MGEQRRLRHLVTRIAADGGATPPRFSGRSSGFLRQSHVDWTTPGAVHTGLGTCTLAPGGHVGRHVHSGEEMFFVTEGAPVLELDGKAYRLGPQDCGLIPLGAPHSWRNPGDAPAAWIDVYAPQDRPEDMAPDVFLVPDIDVADAEPVDIRDPRTRHFFRLGPRDMDLDALKVGAAVDAPTVSASMATALLAYSGIAVKMLVDQRLGATQANMFMVDYQPGGIARAHDHPLEEAYVMLEGEVEFIADGQVYTLRPGDVAFAGVGCVHSFEHRGTGPVRWLETQAPLPPTAQSYRFDRDWDHLAERIGAEG